MQRLIDLPESLKQLFADKGEMDAVEFGMLRMGAMEDFGLLGSPYVWPNVQREYLCKRHLKQIERLNFMAFLIGNGTSPLEARSWVLYPGHQYDKDAVEHVNMLTKYLPMKKINTTYYDMVIGAYVNLMTGEQMGKGNPYDSWYK